MIQLHRDSKRNDFLHRLRDFEREILFSNHDLIKMLKRIPHLDLGIDFDIDKMRKEITKFDVLKPHRLYPSKKLNPSYCEQHAKSFQGVCLFDFVADSYYGMSDSQNFLYQEDIATFTGYRTNYFLTPAGRKTPYIISRLQEISPLLNRTRFIKTPPGGGIPWHSHHNNVYDVGYMRLCILNIPIQTSVESLHGVRNFCNHEEQYFQHYPPGSCYLFNSWHDHCFWNESQEDRLTIVPYFNFADQKLLDFLATRVDMYRGPLLSLEN